MAITTTKLETTAPEAPPADPTAAPAEPADRLLPAIALGLLSGALATLAFPPFGLWPLVFVAFVPMAVGQHRVAPARWSGIVAGVGIGVFIAGQLSVGLHEGDVAPFFELMPLYFAGIFTLVMWRSRRFHTRTDYRWLWITTPLAWVAIDFIRCVGALSSLGGTWANPVYALYKLPTFLQPISVFGMYALELLVLVVNYAIATAIIRRMDGRPLPLPNLAGVAAVVLVWGLLGIALMGSGGHTVRVAAVQTGTTGLPWQVRYQRDIAQTRQAAAQGAQLVTWSEGGLPFDPRVEHTDEIKALAAETKAYIAIGSGFDDAQHRHHNQVVLVSPDGTFSQPYGKDHPGTFANDFSDFGGTYPVVHAPFGTVGTVICYDMDFTDTARKMTRKGARIISASSSDVPAIADTHYTHLVFRSIENRVSTVKGDKGFDSSIIDPWGRIQKLTHNPSGRARRTLVDTVTLGSGKSPFVSFGDYMGWIAVIATSLIVLTSKVSAVRRRRRRSTASA